MFSAYWNLNKNCWSILGSDGRVAKHVMSISLRNCRLVVRPAGREKVLRLKRKNVHAFVRGEEFVDLQQNLGRRLRYNPYDNPFFTFADNGERVDACPVVHLMPNGGAYEGKYDSETR